MTPDPRQLAEEVRYFTRDDGVVFELFDEPSAVAALDALVDALDEVKKRQLIVAGPPRARDSYFMSRIAELEAERDEARSTAGAEAQLANEEHARAERFKAERDRLAETLRLIRDATDEKYTQLVANGALREAGIADPDVVASMEGGGE